MSSYTVVVICPKWCHQFAVDGEWKSFLQEAAKVTSKRDNSISVDLKRINSKVKINNQFMVLAGVMHTCLHTNAIIASFCLAYTSYTITYVPVLFNCQPGL